MLRGPSFIKSNCVGSTDVVTLSVIVNTTTTEVEFVSDLLWGLGVAAIEEQWDPDGTVRLQTSLGDDLAVITTAMNSLSETVQWTTTQVDDESIHSWREFAHPTIIGERLVIAPAWCTETQILRAVESLAKSQEALVVPIEPASTFGLGDHPTTRCSISMIEKYLRRQDSVIDVGCGSGVLGIVALRLGASRAFGIDINPSSVAVSRENARLNHVESRWSVTLEPLAVIGLTANIVVANILAPVLIELQEELKRLTIGGGILIISGVLTDHYQHVAQALLPLREVDRIEMGGWAAVAFQ